jgi:oligopeptidase B
LPIGLQSPPLAAIFGQHSETSAGYRPFFYTPITCTMMTNTPRPPFAAEHPQAITTHGHTRIDPYYWMRDREDPEVIQYLEAENAYLRACLQHTEGFQERLFQEIKGRIKENDQSVPYRLGPYLYYHRFEEGKEYPIYCRKHVAGIDADADLFAAAAALPEEVTLDVNALAEGKPYCMVARVLPSPNHRFLAVATDYVGRRIYEIRIKDLHAGDWLPEALAHADGSMAWAADNQTLFYTTQHEETLRSDRVFRHALGQEQERDAMVFYEEDEQFYVQVEASKSQELIYIHSQSSISTETRFLPSEDPAGEFRVMQPRERQLEYYPSYFNGHFYLLTNDGGAQNFKLATAPFETPGKEHWAELLPHREQVLLEDVELFQEFMVLQERENGLVRLRIVKHDPDGHLGEEHSIDFGEEAYTAALDYNPDFDTHWVRYRFNSLVTPHSYYDYHALSREEMLRKQLEVPGADLDAYESERLWATARDGARVPISLVYRKGTARDGRNPLLLYGYGSYGISIDPYFSVPRLSLLDRGFVFAIAHIRGGQELGRNWYESAKYLSKKNTFHDFIDCAEALVGWGFTSPDRLAIQGGSAGGLLMGAVLNERPELFRAAVADVPFVDVVTTMLDESIPLTTGEFEEWGNPKNPEYYHYMLSYSPYDQVKAQEYPALLVTSGLHDSQVQYWEPTKWVAKLRRTKTDANPLFLKTNMEAGHSGQSGRFQPLRDVALTYAFLIDQLGLPLE